MEDSRLQNGGVELERGLGLVPSYGIPSIYFVQYCIIVQKHYHLHSNTDACLTNTKFILKTLFTQ